MSCELQKKLINAKGAILVHEIPYNGLVIDELPSKFIFGLTNIKSKLIVKILRAAGANTAGVGVCFLSERKFESIFENVRLNLYKKYNVPHVPLSLLYRFALHVKQTTYTDFWLRA